MILTRTVLICQRLVVMHSKEIIITNYVAVIETVSVFVLALLKNGCM